MSVTLPRRRAHVQSGDGALRMRTAVHYKGTRRVRLFPPSTIANMLGAVGRCCTGALQALKPGLHPLKSLVGSPAVLSRKLTPLH